MKSLFRKLKSVFQKWNLPNWMNSVRNILKAVEDNLSEAEFDVQHLAEKSTCHAPH